MSVFIPEFLRAGSAPSSLDFKVQPVSRSGVCSGRRQSDSPNDSVYHVSTFGFTFPVEEAAMSFHSLFVGLGLMAGVLIPAMTSGAPAPDAKDTGPLSFTVKDIDGKEVPLSRYRGDVVMIVNTASLCGNTPQYASLETLYKKYQGKGLRILGFPANNFGAQEPGTNGEIKQFCTLQYHVTFDMFGKVSVKGDDAAPLYRYLTDKKTDPAFGGDIEWNFAKFLVGRDGKVVARYPAGHDPLSADVIAAVEQQLAATGHKA
jgi:glutathione peroxidase